MPGPVVAAIDIGASGGRVMAGVVDGDRVTLEPIHRFPNRATEVDGHLRWNVTDLFEQVLHGLTLLAARHPDVASIGIDTWAVDYALLDADNRLLAEPISHRDARTAEAVDRVHAAVDRAQLFEINGLQFLPFNTIYQLAAEQRGPLWSSAAHVVLLPDLLAFWLTGELRTEHTNATTTGLVEVGTGQWSASLLRDLGIAPAMLPPIDQPGEVRGLLRPELATRIGVQATTVVTTVGSHDTASAFVGVPAVDRDVAYVVSGTWSLVGLELDQPIVSPAAFDAGFTNEGGVDGRTRFLRNVGGLWLLQESMRSWAEADAQQDLRELLDAAASVPPGGPTFDVDDDRFIAPGDMPARIAAAVGRDLVAPATVVRCIIDSLALGYARTIAAATEISGRRVSTIHIVGGGSQNELLCQLTADATGVPVVAGPVEATAFGNVLVQARAIGANSGTLEALRAVVAASTELRRYEPCPTR